MMTLPPAREDLIKLCRDKQKISLIKEHRVYKNSSLKDAKEAIETAQSGSFAEGTCSFAEGTCSFDEQKILALFGYGPEEANKLMAAISLLNEGENWRVLGFPTFKAAVEAVLKNFS